MTWIPQPGSFVQPIMTIPCHRRGTTQLGGHCVYCGFDVAPYACVQYDDDIVICRTKCWTSFQTWELAHLKNLPTQHYSSWAGGFCEEYQLRPRSILV